MVGVAVSAVIAAGGQDTVQQGSAGDNEIQLVPVTRSGVPPGHSVVGFCGEERVCDVEIVEGAQPEEFLPVLVEFAYAKVADVSGP